MGLQVVAVGDKVSLKVGDHVSPVFNLSRVPGADDRDGPSLGLGGDVEGVLAEYRVFKENVLVKLPKELSWEEVFDSRWACKSCADLSNIGIYNSLRCCDSLDCPSLPCKSS